MAGHTPGPWFVNGPWHIQADTKLAVPSIVANVIQPRNGDIQEREANARLIAAAPDLLEALHDCLAIVQDEYDEDPEPEELTSWRRTIDAARAAIAKATEPSPVPSA